MMPMLLALMLAGDHPPPSIEPQVDPFERIASLLFECQDLTSSVAVRLLKTRVALSTTTDALDDERGESRALRAQLTAIPPVPTATNAPDLRLAIGLEGSTTAIVVGIVIGVAAGVAATVAGFEIF